MRVVCRRRSGSPIQPAPTGTLDAMPHEKQRAIKELIQSRYPKGHMPQQDFRMVLNLYLLKDLPLEEAEAQAIASVRERYPDFVPERVPE